MKLVLHEYVATFQRRAPKTHDDPHAHQQDPFDGTAASKTSWIRMQYPAHSTNHMRTLLYIQHFLTRIRQKEKT